MWHYRGDDSDYRDSHFAEAALFVAVGGDSWTCRNIWERRWKIISVLHRIYDLSESNMLLKDL